MKTLKIEWLVKMSKMAKKYPGDHRYVLETDYGCYSEYGWTIACSSETMDEGIGQYEFWKGKHGKYRLVDGKTGFILLSSEQHNGE